MNEERLAVAMLILVAWNVSLTFYCFHLRIWIHKLLQMVYYDGHSLNLLVKKLAGIPNGSDSTEDSDEAIP